MVDGVDSFAAPARLLDRVRDKIRLRHYSIRTEQAYVDWIRRFILYHGKRHPETLGGPEVEGFLTHLAVDRDVAAATQNLAKSSILFLYRDVLSAICRGSKTSSARARPRDCRRSSRTRKSPRSSRVCAACMA
jgi:hypothetical protein